MGNLCEPRTTHPTFEVTPLPPTSPRLTAEEYPEYYKRMDDTVGGLEVRAGIYTQVSKNIKQKIVSERGGGDERVMTGVELK